MKMCGFKLALAVFTSMSTISEAADVTGQSGPLRLTEAQMDQVTAGAVLVSAEGYALAIGDNSLAIALSKTSASSWKAVSMARGQSSTLAAGDLAAYIENTGIAATDTLLLIVEAEGLGVGDAVAVGEVLTFTLDGPITDITTVNSTVEASGSTVDIADVTVAVGVDPDSWVSGNIVTHVIENPRRTVAMAHGAIASHTFPVLIAKEHYVQEKILAQHTVPQLLTAEPLVDHGPPQHIVPKGKVVQ